MRRFIQVGASLLIAVGGLLAALSPVAAGGRSDVVGHVYVNNNSAGTNTVADRTFAAVAEPLAGADFAKAIRELILKGGTPAEQLGHGPAFRLRRVVRGA